MPGACLLVYWIGSTLQVVDVAIDQFSIWAIHAASNPPKQLVSARSLKRAASLRQGVDATSADDRFIVD